MTPQKITQLEKKVIKGGGWVLAGRITQRVILFVRTVILARILSPGDFGLFGIAMLGLMVLETFSEGGFHQALIQKKDNITGSLNTAWTINAVRGVIIAFLLFISGPAIASFFDVPLATPLIRMIGISVIFTGMTNIAVVYFDKELDFRRLFFFNYAGVLAEVIVSISLAFLLRDARALVVGNIAGNFTRLILSYTIEPYRPRFEINISRLKELFHFGKWITGTRILSFLALKGDDIFVGKMLGAISLGFYQMAYFMGNMPSTEITQTISRVVFPAYSKMQENTAKLRHNYIRVLKVSTFFSLAASGLILVLMSDFTRIFLGEKWLPIVFPGQILVLFGVVRSLVGVNGALFNAIGKPRIITLISAAKLILLIIFILPLADRFGISGVAAAVLLSGLIVSPASFIMAAKNVTEGSLYQVVRVIIVPLAGFLFLTSAWFLFVPRSLSIIQFIAGAFVYGAGYICITFLLDKLLNHGIWKDLKFVFTHLPG